MIDRPLQISSRTDLPDLIRQGTFDVILHKIPEAVEQRQAARRASLEAQVKEVFGQDAVISVEHVEHPRYPLSGNGPDA